jgi:glycerol-3-phosphate dehydrogenase (NAD(P)+)
VVEAINESHTNPEYLPDIAIHPRVRAQIGAEGIETADIVIMAVPAQHTREALTAIGPERLAGKPVVLAAKGLERDTQLRQSQVLAQVAAEAIPLALSGPTAVSLAGADVTHTEKVAALLAGPTFRPYAGADLVGVELAGALKNVFAIACGAVDGAGLGLSARAAVLARAFAELRRLVSALGGAPATLTGLAGLGDLVLSCTTRQSRNFEFGRRLAAGEPAAHALVEGRHTAPAALSLAVGAAVDAPITAAVNALISGQAEIGELVAALMTRPLKRENDTQRVPPEGK